MAKKTFTAYSGKRYNVTVRTGKDRTEPSVEDPFGGDFFSNRPTTWNGPRIRIADGSTWLGTAPRSAFGDLANVYRANRLETSVVPSATRVFEINELLRANVSRPVEPILYSGRVPHFPDWPFQANDETNGFNTVLKLRDRSRSSRENPGAPRDRLFAIQSGQPWVRQMRPPAEQLARLDTVADTVSPLSRADYTEARDRVRRLGLEKWGGVSAARTQKDAIFQPSVPPGAYEAEVISPVHFRPWHMFDESLYTITTEPYFDAPRAHLGFGVGADMTTELHMHLMPARQRYTYQYWTMYLLGTLFWFTYIYGISTGTFDDRLPFEPYPYTHTGIADTAVNDVAVSKWIEQSNRYALSLLQDNALNYTTPWSFMFLIDRVEGRWTLRRGAREAGELCAIVDAKRASATTRYYVFNRVSSPATGEILDFGPFGTDLVSPMARTGPVWNFTQHLVYGPV